MVRGRGRQTDREKTTEQAEARVERGRWRAEREAWAARWGGGAAWEEIACGERCEGIRQR
jgi:hypothetical protein